MALKIPKMNYSSNITKHGRSEFGGYYHRYDCGDGKIYDMKNMSSELYPVLSPRKKRYLVSQLTAPKGLYGHDGLYYVDGGALYKNGAATALTGLSSTEKTFVTMHSYLIILPDKKYYNMSDGTVGGLESKSNDTKNIKVKIKNGTYAEEPADANTVKYDDDDTDFDWADYFKVGDAVTISGCTNEKNNKTPIVREIDGDELRFYENTFTIEGTSETENSVTFERTVPDMDFIFEHENRLWGCDKKTIYASKQGDPFNWNVFDGIASDSYFVEVGSAGDFTGAASYLGYPIFFKEDLIYKMYGNKPTNFELLSSANIGAMKSKSIAVANNVMYYLSRNGVCAYTGGMPSMMDDPFGEDKYDDAVAGTDSKNYHISMKRGSTWDMFVYDADKRVWMKEDNTQAKFFAFDGGKLYFVDAQNKLWCKETVTGGTAEDSVASEVEFGDFTVDSPDKKGFGRIQIRAEVDADSTLAVSMKYDNGAYTQVRSVSGTKNKQTFLITLLPKRCDHFRMKLSGTGMWRVYSMAWETYAGSEY